MTAGLTDALKRHRHLRGPRVLCREDDRPYTLDAAHRRMARVQRRAGLPVRGLHILRHTFCSHLAMKGAPARAHPRLLPLSAHQRPHRGLQRQGKASETTGLRI
jgi:integrase